MLDKSRLKRIISLIAIFFLFFESSLLAFSYPDFNQVLGGLFIIAFLSLALWRFEYALLAVYAELFVGSMGHLFVFDIFGRPWPVRMIFFLLLMAVFFFRLARDFWRNGRLASFWQSWKKFSPRYFYYLLAFFVVFGALNSFLRGQYLAAAISDANAWLYFLLIFPTVEVYAVIDSAKIRRLKEVFLAATAWLSLETFVFLFFFSHKIFAASGIYLWLRSALIGEMTMSLSGWPRIFIQGQVFSAVAFFFVFWESIRRFCLTSSVKKNERLAILVYLLASAFFLTPLFLSLSRSFWVGLLAALGLFFVWLLAVYGWRAFLKGAAFLFGASLASFFLVYLVIAIPYGRQAVDISDSFMERLDDSSGAAVSSRWALLPVLWQEVSESPFIGQGFGASLTYRSSDPRVLERNPEGWYTTYAFEWAYLDIWLKIGLFGLLAYLVFLAAFFLESKKKIDKNKQLALPLLLSLIFLSTVNFFTPYLNHPLGIGFLVLGSCLIWLDNVY